MRDTRIEQMIPNLGIVDLSDGDLCEDVNERKTRMI